MTFKLIVIQSLSRWRLHNKYGKLKKFNANSISKVSKICGGLTLGRWLIDLGYNGLYFLITKNALLCRMHDWISSLDTLSMEKMDYNSIIFSLSDC